MEGLLGMTGAQQGMVAIIVSAIAAVGAVLAAFINNIGRKATARAAQVAAQAAVRTAEASAQEKLNDAFAKYTEQLQEDRGQDRKRILECEGRCAALEQWAISLERLLRKHGIDVPPRPSPAAIVHLQARTGEAPHRFRDDNGK
jgi:hypothetical protein